MADAVSAFDFLSREQMPAVPPVCVLFGDEPLLIHESLEKLRSAVLTGDDGELSFTALEGDGVELRAVFDELATLSMFGGGKRMVVVEDADDFVSQHRADLEKYCQQPRAAAVLVLQVQSWPANTRLYKRIAEMGLQINCNLPRGRFGDIDEDAVSAWLEKRAQRQHQVRLEAGAGEQLLEIVGPQLGRLDQELAKLALLAQVHKAATAGRAGAEQSTADQGQRTISRQLVEQTVGGWRTKTAWVMIEAALEGNAAAALVELDRLLLAGEEPIALLAMMSGSLRRMAAAARIAQQALAERGRRIPLQEALREAGVTPKKFVLDKTEKQLKQIGWSRAKQIYRWLLEADLALKGSSSTGPRARLVLEQLIVRLSKQLAPAKY